MDPLAVRGRARPASAMIERRDRGDIFGSSLSKSEAATGSRNVVSKAGGAEARLYEGTSRQLSRRPASALGKLGSSRADSPSASSGFQAKAGAREAFLAFGGPSPAKDDLGVLASGARKLRPASAHA